jgi:hypothetical protein
LAYARTIWTNREVEKPRTYTFQANGDGTNTLLPAEGNIISEGTPITADTMNNIENYLEVLSAYSEVSEKGQNANGSYMRYSSGFQVCWGQGQYQATTGPNGALHAVTLPIKALPATFSHTTYYVGITPYFTEAVGVDVRTRNFTDFEPRIFSISALTDKAIILGFFAFGRWFE